MARLNYPTAILLAGLLVWVLFSASLLFITANNNPNIRSAAYVSPSPLPTIMAIKTRKTSIKEKPTKAGSASIIHPARRSPSAQSEQAAIAEFEDQEWVKDIIHAGTEKEGTKKTKAYVDPNVAFPFADDFSVRTINGANVPKCAPDKNAKRTTAPSDFEDHPALATPVTQGEIIQISDDNKEDDVSVLTTKTQDELVALLVKARRAHQVANAGLRAASGSGHLPGNGLVATPPHPNAGGQKTCPTSNAHDGNAGVAVGTEVSSGPGGK